MNDFPAHEPLSGSRIADLCQAARSGCAASRHRLIVNNLRLVSKVASGFTGNKSDYEDLASAGVIALHRCIDTYEPAKGAWSALSRLRSELSA